MGLINRSSIDVDTKKLKRLHKSIKDPTITRNISKKMAAPVLKAAILFAPINKTVDRTKRYVGTGSHGGKGRAKKKRIWATTTKGNLKRSHTIYDTIAGGERTVNFVRVGPKTTKKAGRPYAFYAWAVHKLHNPWLKKAWVASKQKSIEIGIRETKKILKNGG